MQRSLCLMLFQLAFSCETLFTMSSTFIVFLLPWLNDTRFLLSMNIILFITLMSPQAPTLHKSLSKSDFSKDNVSLYSFTRTLHHRFFLIDKEPPPYYHQDCHFVTACSYSQKPVSKKQNATWGIEPWTLALMITGALFFFCEPYIATGMMVEIHMAVGT